ncbi:MAG TPA: hypothetical protein VH189_16240 [Rhizomicrobium sp.]|nr:hypothetical protein [Rhizomicrobium sp.]
MRFGKIALLLVLSLGGPATGQSLAQALDKSLAPPSWPVGEAELRLNGEASGALFNPDQPGWRALQASGALRLMPELKRSYDSGLLLALDGTFTAADPLSRGRYDGDAIERLTGSAQTGLGKIEIGVTDGAGYGLAVMGPRVDAGVSLDDPRTTFFRDPNTHRAVTDMFALRTEVGASSNYAKIAYTSPALFGAQIALSFTPSEAKQLPFLNAGPHLPGRQVEFWEAALKYETDLGPLSLSGYGAVSESRTEHKRPGQEGTSDLGAGLKADYPLDEETSLSLGGAFRQSNAYGFDVNQSWQAGTTRVGHVSAAVSHNAWMAGVEYGTGTADAVSNLPRLGLNGLEASIGYRLSDSMRISSGWQHLSYSRSAGLFFNGAPQLKMEAVYLHLMLNTSEE